MQVDINRKANQLVLTVTLFKGTVLSFIVRAEESGFFITKSKVASEAAISFPFSVVCVAGSWLEIVEGLFFAECIDCFSSEKLASTWMEIETAIKGTTFPLHKVTSSNVSKRKIAFNW